MLCSLLLENYDLLQFLAGFVDGLAAHEGCAVKIVKCLVPHQCCATLLDSRLFGDVLLVVLTSPIHWVWLVYRFCCADIIGADFQ